MANISVKEAKAKLQSLINELDKIDDDAKFIVELDDNCGGSYIDDITKFKLDTSCVAACGEVCLTNLQ